VALFGGSFDPIHSGHIAVARVACRRFGIDEVHFIPAGRPPHKKNRHLVPYLHRLAMVALACAGEPRFLPSLAEAGEDLSGRGTCYSIDVVRAFRRKLRRGQRLYFLVGADAFLTIGSWKESAALLEACEFLVATRPGVSDADLRRALPEAMRRPGVRVLHGVNSPCSSSAIRLRVSRGLSIRGLVPAAVEDYICKLALYR
jgi:nicotinate-nucleotide adenylyltransferase